MYVIRQKATKTIIFATDLARDPELKPTEIFPPFDRDAMEIGWTDKVVLPSVFDIDAEGRIQPSPGAPAAETVQFNEGFETPDGQSAIRELPLVEAVEKNAFQTAADCRRALAELKAQMERQIAEAVPIGLELKRTKGYMSWLKEGKPDNDERERAYLAMQTRIQDIRNNLRPLKKKVKARLAELSGKS